MSGGFPKALLLMQIQTVKVNAEPKNASISKPIQAWHLKSDFSGAFFSLLQIQTVNANAETIIQDKCLLRVYYEAGCKLYNVNTELTLTFRFWGALSGVSIQIANANDSLHQDF